MVIPLVLHDNILNYNKCVLLDKGSLCFISDRKADDDTNTAI